MTHGRSKLRVRTRFSLAPPTGQTPAIIDDRTKYEVGTLHYANLVYYTTPDMG